MIIEGHIDTRTVTIDGKPLDPVPSQEVLNHSPDGFAWGYGGSGPAQLALALLLAYGMPPKRAVAYHQRFKAAFLATLPRESFRIEVDVDAWITKMEPVTIEPTESER